MTFRHGHTAAAKLSPADVVEIRRLWMEEGWSQARIARMKGMSETQIGRICRGTSWSKLAMPVDQRELGYSQAAVQTDTAMAVPLSLSSDFLAELAAIKHSAEAEITAPLMKPDAEIAARMAAYGVRPPVPKELIEQLATPVHSSRSAGSEPSKPVIQAQSAQDAQQQRGGRDASAARCQTPECRYDAGHSGRCKSEQGFYLSAAPGGDDGSRQATPDDDRVIGVLDQVTEEAGK